MQKPIYEFAGVELDTAKRQIHSGLKSRDISPLVFEALVLFASHGNQTVSKDELAEALWSGRVVTEASITQTIRKARAALEECGADPAIIKTQHGHGYRLDADVSVKSSEVAASDWRQHRFRTGAIAAILGVVLVTVANISDILSWIIPDESVQLLEETQSTIESTDAKVDELVQLLRDRAARAGNGLDIESEDTIREALSVIVDSVDARKQTALDQLVEGDVNAAAASIVVIAQDLDSASAKSVDAAAASWREAGALYYTIDVDKAVESYESAYRLRPDDPLFALDLAYTYIRAGHLDDALVLFEAVEVLDADLDIRADARRGVGTARKLMGEYEAAKSMLSQAMTAAKDAGSLRQQALILLQQGALARAQGDNLTAFKQFERAVTIAEEINDQHLLAETLNNLGIIQAVSGDFVSASNTLTRALDTHVARFDLAGQATALGNLGATALTKGDVDSAEAYLIESVAIGEQLSWQRSIALDLVNLGGIAAARQEFDVAEERLTKALDIAVAAQLNEIQPIILVNMGEVARDRDDVAEACRLWAEALPLLQAMQHGAAEIVITYQDDLACR